MTDIKSTTKPAEIGDHDRFEYVLLCDLDAGETGKRLAYTRTMKWRETVLQTRIDPQKGESVEELGFLVTVPRPAGPGGIHIYSHICRDEAAHVRAIAILENEKKDKERTDGRLPTVWNGKFIGCPLCAVLPQTKGSEG